MTDKIKIRLILVMAFVALILGFLLVSKFSPKTKETASIEKTPSLINNGQFTEDEIKLLKPPGPGASKDIVEEHNKLAAKLAVTGTEVDISECKAKPLVLQSSQTSKVKMKNSGKAQVSISFDGKKNVKVATGKSAEINSELVHGPGLYGYLCEQTGFKGLVGFVLVTP